VGIKQAEKISQKDSSLIRAVDEKGKEWWDRKLVLATGITDVCLSSKGTKSVGLVACKY
jgi:hypothetical protein